MTRSKIMVLLTIALLTLWTPMLWAKDSRPITRGMSKQEVTEILGKPRSTSFDENGERWVYTKSKYLGLITLCITVEFDRSDHVVRYNSDEVDSSNTTANTQTSSQTGQGYQGSYHGGYRGYCRCLTEDQMNTLLQKIQKKSFAADKLDLVEVAALSGWFTCAQCATLMDQFTFTHDKLQVVKLVAPRLIDPRNSNVIMSRLSFDSDRKKAADYIAAT